MIECFLESIGMRALGLCQGFEPIGNFFKIFFSRRFGHTRIHIGIFVSFTSYCCGKIRRGRANRQACCRVADFLQILEMTVRMTRLALSR